MHVAPLATEAGMPELTGLVGWIVDVVEALGAVGVGIAVAIVWSTIGSVVGALGAYSDVLDAVVTVVVVGGIGWAAARRIARRRREAA